MGSGSEVVEIDSLERGLLLSTPTSSQIQVGAAAEAEEEPVLYAASFEEMEENFVKYQTAQWVVYSLLLILAWGIGLFMLLYVPVRRYILREDIRSRKLFLTPNSIVYKVISQPHVLLFFFHCQDHCKLINVSKRSFFGELGHLN